MTRIWKPMRSHCRPCVPVKASTSPMAMIDDEPDVDRAKSAAAAASCASAASAARSRRMMPSAIARLVIDAPETPSIPACSGVVRATSSHDFPFHVFMK